MAFSSLHAGRLAVMTGNAKAEDGLADRAGEVEELIDAVKTLVIPFIRAADQDVPQKATGRTIPGRNVLVDGQEPEQLATRLAASLRSGEGRGRQGLLDMVSSVLANSVNTWDQGFLDKLYACTDAVGVATEMLLAVLNTNVHVYAVSPALTVIEKETARWLAGLFGLHGPRAGGFTCAGGSASNLTAFQTARSALYPETRARGNGTRHFVVFTSAHGHYSVEKAAVAMGLGAGAVRQVPVDATTGAMRPEALRDMLAVAVARGETPLLVNATAGTTVLGAFDPLEAVAHVCRAFTWTEGPAATERRVWLHADASWGGCVVFSARRAAKLAGSALVDSLTVNPHKMLGVPLTCSFLLTNDTAVFHGANTLPAGYLFHGSNANGACNGAAAGPREVWDLADLTMQCGRRGDSLKLALSRVYHGAAGLGRRVDGAFETAAYLAAQVAAREPEFRLVSTNPPPCLQVCFYYAGPAGTLPPDAAETTRCTRHVVSRLVPRGFMVDYAPGDRGAFFRVVVNWQTLRGTVDGLLKAVADVGREYVVGMGRGAWVNKRSP